MENDRPALESTPPSLTDRFGQYAIPALHLWWRFSWRILLLPIGIMFAISIIAMISASRAVMLDPAQSYRFREWTQLPLGYAFPFCVAG